MAQISLPPAGWLKPADQLSPGGAARVDHHHMQAVDRLEPADSGCDGAAAPVTGAFDGADLEDHEFAN